MQVFETLCGHTCTQCFHELDNLNFLQKSILVYAVVIRRKMEYINSRERLRQNPLQKESSVQIEMVQRMCFS